MILSVTYGVDPKSTDDPFLSATVAAAHALAAAMVPGKFLVDTVPMRAYLYPDRTQAPLTTPWTVRYLPGWFPGTGFKALAKEIREKYQIAMDGPMEYVKNAMKVSLQGTRGRVTLRLKCNH